ncbi:bifunctional pyr operon transcriptional regulator/uracil phosphoribosyltransferase PyrR [Falsarthrobacter nasiphocae]|uniref:Bifunctional protein PyrR n=1 Tax=Falsarthrobacter nasiphocae TaxID=189863 RepID=A0AAE3YFQ9_9MICC|nr:bifunctional pyr operon transcriptional regulator/uracil phosphoribosyltransferase PyrR [Falsarthrobacter nasiphocae]MDR6892983.1 pyrimidine operon attenuation protein/uracil phosphoribosyltransferase [Falsarthrobacter nasiphocae]
MTADQRAQDGAGTEGGRQVLSGPEIERALTRMAFEILEGNKGPENLVLLGIVSRGYPLAQRLARRIAANAEGVTAEDIVGRLDVTMFRDDLGATAFRAPSPTVLPEGGIDGKTVVLVDDVLFSGRTIRAALDALVELGRPSRVRLAVLVDRGHRELPIRADHVGRNLPSSSRERVMVRLSEVDDAGDQVVIEDRGTGESA